MTTMFSNSTTTAMTTTTTTMDNQNKQKMKNYKNYHKKQQRFWSMTTTTKYALTAVLFVFVCSSPMTTTRTRTTTSSWIWNVSAFEMKNRPFRHFQHQHQKRFVESSSYSSLLNGNQNKIVGNALWASSSSLSSSSSSDRDTDTVITNNGSSRFTSSSSSTASLSSSSELVSSSPILHIQRKYNTFRWYYNNNNSNKTFHADNDNNNNINNNQYYYNINYRVEGKKDGPPVLLIHGFGANVNHFRFQFPTLVQQGYRVYAIDLLGFGASDKPSEPNYSIELFVQLLKDFIKYHDEQNDYPTKSIMNKNKRNNKNNNKNQGIFFGQRSGAASTSTITTTTSASTSSSSSTSSSRTSTTTTTTTAATTTMTSSSSSSSKFFLGADNDNGNANDNDDNKIHNQGYYKWIVAGNSIGGLCSLGVAKELQNNDRIGGVILLNCAGGMTGFRYEDVPIYIRPMLYFVQKVLLNPNMGGSDFFSKFKTRENVESILKNQGVYQNHTHVDEVLLETLLGPADDEGAEQVFLKTFGGPPGPTPEELLPHVQCPILTIWGSNDPWTPVDKGMHPGNQFYKYVKNPNWFELVVLQGVGHCPHDEAPDQVHKVMLPWMKSIVCNEK